MTFCVCTTARTRMLQSWQNCAGTLLTFQDLSHQTELPFSVSSRQPQLPPRDVVSRRKLSLESGLVTERKFAPISRGLCQVVGRFHHRTCLERTAPRSFARTSTAKCTRHAKC